MSAENIGKKRPNAGHFQSGNPGKPKGAVSKKTMAEREAAEWMRNYAIDSGTLQKSWKRTCELAERGVQWAVEMVVERCAGKKPLEITTPLDGELRVVIHRVEE
jgi:hypothetical protein